MGHPARILASTLVLTAVATILVLVGCVPAWAEQTDSVEDRVDRAYDRSDVPGLIAVVVHDDRVVWSSGRGAATGHP